MTILEKTQETPGPPLLSCCCSPQAVSAFVSISSRSKKSINIKTHKAERKVCKHKWIPNWLVMTDRWAPGWRGRDEDCQFKHLHRPFKKTIITNHFRFLKSSWEFSESKDHAVFLRSAQPFSSPHSFPKHIHLAKALH